MFKTLFSRMLATYLSVTLGLLFLLGITVGSMFQQQYIGEKEGELRREAEEINETVASRYMDGNKRPVAEQELLITARKYDALIVLRFADDQFGKRAFMDETAQDKWAGSQDLDVEAMAAAILSGQEEGGIVTDMLRDRVDFPVMTLTAPVKDGEGNIIAALFLHTDMSRINASIRQVWMDVLLYSCVAVLTAFLSVSYITGRITKPIIDMNATVLRFSKGAFNLRIPAQGQDEVAQLGKSFNLMADALNNLEQARRSFVANVSHELRSPLTSMRGFLEAMQDGTIPQEEAPKYLAIVIDENKRMTAMVNDLLDLARIESGQTVVHMGPFDINELIARTLLTFEARIDAAKIEVELDFSEEHCYVEADADQIAQVLRNLIDNAIKFTPGGGRLRLSTEPERKLVWVRVSDSGKGVAQEDIPYLFDRFYKAEKAHTPGSQSGTGLGLSIVKRIIEAHGQDISVESQPGQGTTFTFTLKRTERPQPNGKASQRRELANSLHTERKTHGREQHQHEPGTPAGKRPPAGKRSPADGGPPVSP